MLYNRDWTGVSIQEFIFENHMTMQRIIQDSKYLAHIYIIMFGKTYLFYLFKLAISKPLIKIIIFCFFKYPEIFIRK